jgi:hypothetical protein
MFPILHLPLIQLSGIESLIDSILEPYNFPLPTTVPL